MNKELESNMVVSVEKKSNEYIYKIIKRIFDLLCSIIGLVFLIPITIIVKVLYMITGDFKSIFFTQKRIGINGKEFRLFKFRTMIPNADQELKRLLKENKELNKEYKKNKKLKNDPRITKVGKILRKASLDELPQVLNILVGSMSVIGNRPYLPREKEDMGKDYDIIVSSKPGLTGYWQVSGRSNTTFGQRLKLEKYYSENCNLKIDVKIFFKTFKVVLFGKGAD